MGDISWDMKTAKKHKKSNELLKKAYIIEKIMRKSKKRAKKHSKNRYKELKKAKTH